MLTSEGTLLMQFLARGNTFNLSDMCRHETSKTMNSKGLVKQEDKSNPPPTPSRHCQTTCQSVLKGRN